VKLVKVKLKSEINARVRVHTMLRAEADRMLHVEYVIICCVESRKLNAK
jgi:hypothetical protein